MPLRLSDFLMDDKMYWLNYIKYWMVYKYFDIKSNANYHLVPLTTFSHIFFSVVYTELLFGTSVLSFAFAQPIRFDLDSKHALMQILQYGGLYEFGWVPYSDLRTSPFNHYSVCYYGKARLINHIHNMHMGSMNVVLCEKLSVSFVIKSHDKSVDILKKLRMLIPNCSKIMRKRTLSVSCSHNTENHSTSKQAPHCGRVVDGEL